MPRFPFLVREDTSLDGEPAVMEHPDPMGGGWSFLGMDEHVFAVHDGRAVVISFDYESIRRGRITEEEIASILDSFEFTDE